MNSNTSAATMTAPEVSLTPAEIAQAKLYLEQTRDYLLGAIKGLSDTQWKFKPAADRWSIAEIVEHILFVQRFVLETRREQLKTAPPPPEGYPSEQVDAIILHQFPLRLTKAQAPPFANPAGSLTLAEAQERIPANHERLLEFLESTPDLRHHAVEGPPLKLVSNGAYEWMDGYHWILAQAAHTERHTKQILELKAGPAFPDA